MLNREELLFVKLKYNLPDSFNGLIYSDFKSYMDSLPPEFLFDYGYGVRTNTDPTIVTPYMSVYTGKGSDRYIGYHHKDYMRRLVNDLIEYENRITK